MNANANTKVNTMRWLIRREFWENKGSMFWTPVIVGALMVLFIAGTVIWKVASDGIMDFGVHINGKQVDLSQAYHALTPEQRASIVNGIASSYLAVSAPLFAMLSVVVFFYCLGALYDERRDRSILFWKSLPLSDAATVLSKVATALCLAPAITIAVATATSLLLLLIGGLIFASHGTNLFGLLLTTPQFYLTPFQLIALLPVYALWALPTVGYLLMVSAWARSKVFLWAVGIPLMIAAVVKWTDFLSGGRGLKAEWFMEHIVVRGLGGLAPGGWLAGDKVPNERLLHAGDKMVDMGMVVKHSYLALGDMENLIGVAAGAAMIYAAMRLRRWKDEG